MKISKSFKTSLLLEQLENRIFLDANPLAAVDTVDQVEQPLDQPLPVLDHAGETTTVEPDPEPAAVDDTAPPDTSAPPCSR
ncbi:MAG: LEPR-XLL domain-containing protein [Desulfobulbaceae bacterium]|nr:LEPR-XLL domain-containing protein [Desulfobulbaceae bacterium]